MTYLDLVGCISGIDGAARLAAGLRILQASAESDHPAWFRQASTETDAAQKICQTPGQSLASFPARLAAQRGGRH